MIKNMGPADRTVRLVLAAVLVALVLFAVDGALAWVLGLLAVVLVATSLVGTCPAYLPLGLSTCRRPV